MNTTLLSNQERFSVLGTGCCAIIVLENNPAENGKGLASVSLYADR